MSQQPPTNLMDHHNRLIVEVVTRFGKIISLATEPAVQEGQHPDLAAMGTARLQMQLEQEALTTALKDLLALSRRIKELWVFGPLGARDSAATSQAQQIDHNVQQVAQLVASLEERKMAQLAAKHGGTWKEKSTGEGAGQ